MASGRSSALLRICIYVNMCGSRCTAREKKKKRISNETKKALLLFFSKREKKVKKLVKQNKKPQRSKEIKRRQLTKKKQLRGKRPMENECTSVKEKKSTARKEKKTLWLVEDSSPCFSFFFFQWQISLTYGDVFFPSSAVVFRALNSCGGASKYTPDVYPNCCCCCCCCSNSIDGPGSAIGIPCATATL